MAVGMVRSLGFEQGEYFMEEVFLVVAKQLVSM